MSTTRNPLHSLFVLALPLLFLAPIECAADQPLTSKEIIGNYVAATQPHPETAADVSMEVEIQASVPKLQESGRLRAMRRISHLGLVSYRVIAFQGSNLIKNDVIARFLQADQQSQTNSHLALTPANYKFKLRYERMGPGSEDVYVFAVSPRAKQLGLFKGELWLDARSYLPVFEKGRLVKNPSVFFKKVDFERNFSIAGGKAIPQHMNSTIGVRLIGTVQLEVNYSNYSTAAEPVAEARTSAANDSILAGRSPLPDIRASH